MQGLGTLTIILFPANEFAVLNSRFPSRTKHLSFPTSYNGEELIISVFSPAFLKTDHLVQGHVSSGVQIFPGVLSRLKKASCTSPISLFPENTANINRNYQAGFT